jgi:hypothetical protein
MARVSHHSREGFGCYRLRANAVPASFAVRGYFAPKEEQLINIRSGLVVGTSALVLSRRLRRA